MFSGTSRSYGNLQSQPLAHYILYIVPHRVHTPVKTDPREFVPRDPRFNNAILGDH